MMMMMMMTMMVVVVMMIYIAIRATVHTSSLKQGQHKGL
jgi:hypothetical protein